MNAIAMPAAVTRLAGSTSNGKLPSGRMNDSQTKPAARVARPATVIALGPNRAMSRGATATIPTMIVTVSGSSAAPLANAPSPSTCCRYRLRKKNIGIHAAPSRNWAALAAARFGRLEDAQPHQRLAGLACRRDEHPEQHHSDQAGDQGRRRGPARLRGAHDREHDGRESGGDGGGAGDVDASRGVPAPAGITDGVSRTTAAASGTLMKNTHGQDAYWVRTPPRNTPAVPPAGAAAP